MRPLNHDAGSSSRKIRLLGQAPSSGLETSDTLGLSGLMTPRAKEALSVFLKIFWVFLFLVLALGWFVLDGSTTRPRVVRSRRTIVVETPEGERSGSSVTQETISFHGGLRRAQGWALWTDFVGEAVVVDLGQRGLLFATLVKPSWFNSPGWGGSGGYSAG